jgi:hypothetical protein
VPDNELIIYFKMVDQATGVARRTGAAMRQEIDQTAKAQDKADQAYVRAIKLQERAYKDLANSKIKASKDAATQQKRDEDAYIRAVKQNASAAAKIDKDQTSSRERLNRQTNALLRQLLADEARAAKQADAEKVRSSRSAFSAWKQDHDNQHKLTMMNFSQEQAALKEQAQHARDAANAKASIAKEFAAADRRAQAEIDRLFKWGQEEQVKATRQAIRDKRSAEKQEFRDWKQQHDNQHSLTMQSWAQEQAAIKEQEAAQNASTRAVMGYIGAFVGIGTVIAGVKSLADYYDQIRRDTNEAVKEVIHYHEIVRQLAALTGKMGDTTPAVAANLQLRAQTGLSANESINLAQNFRGTAQAAEKKFAPGTLDDFMLELGKLSMLEGSSGGSAGNLGGILAMEAKAGTSADELKKQAASEFAIQQPGRFVSLEEYAGQRQKISASIQTGIVTREQGATLLSGLSNVEGAGTSGERFDQLMRAVSTGMYRARHPKLAPGTQFETSSSYFKKLGLTEDVDPYHRALAIAADIERERKSHEAKGKRFDVDVYQQLQGGFTLQEDREVLRNMYAMTQGDNRIAWETIQKSSGAPAQSIGEIYKDEAGRSPVIQQGLADVARDTSNFRKANNSPEAKLRQTFSEAFSNLKAKDQVSGEFNAWADRGWWDKTTAFVTGYDERIKLEAQRNLAAQAKKAGIDFQIPMGRVRGNIHVEQYVGDEKMVELQQEIQRRGGNPLGGVVDKTAETLQVLREIRDAIKPPAPAPPPQPLQVQPGPMNRPNRLGG